MADNLKAYLQRKKAEAEQSERLNAAAKQSRKEQQDVLARERVAQLSTAIDIANAVKAELGNDAVLDVAQGGRATLSGFTLTLAANKRRLSYSITTSGGQFICTRSLVEGERDRGRGPVPPEVIERLDESTIRELIRQMIDALYDDGRIKIPD